MTTVSAQAQQYPETPPASPGPVLLLGSGETSSTARKIYDQLLKGFDPPVRMAVLETPAGFEPNSDRVAGRVAEFFRARLPHYRPIVEVVPARARNTPYSPDNPDILAPLWTADVIFAGAGSPSYAVRQLRVSLCWQSVLARHTQGAVLILASAATIAASRHTLPVYEIFKVGEELHWKPGLDIFGRYGLELAIVTHWNNREGGEELDTSHGFMGRARFERLRAMLPETATVLGIDEHTGVILLPSQETCRVLGVGGATILHNGEERRVNAPGSFPLGWLGRFQMPERIKLCIPESVWQQIKQARLEAEVALRPTPEVLELVAARETAREKKNWERADALRAEIERLGWTIEDTPDGPRVTRATAP